MLCLALIFQPFLDNIDLFSPILTINLNTSGSTKALVFVFHTSHFHVCLKIFILWILVRLFRLFLVLHRWTPPLSCHQDCQGREGVGRTQEGPRSQDRQAGDPYLVRGARPQRGEVSSGIGVRLCLEVLDAVQAMTSKNHIHSKLGDDLGGLKGVELLVPGSRRQHKEYSRQRSL